MLNTLKTAYCFYIIQILLDCKDEFCFNTSLDKIIDNEVSVDQISNDPVLKEIFVFVCEYRKFNRCLVKYKPTIETKIVLKSLYISLF